MVLLLPRCQRILPKCCGWAWTQRKSSQLRDWAKKSLPAASHSYQTMKYFLQMLFLNEAKQSTVKVKEERIPTTMMKSNWKSSNGIQSPFSAHTISTSLHLQLHQHTDGLPPAGQEDAPTERVKARLAGSMVHDRSHYLIVGVVEKRPPRKVGWVIRTVEPMKHKNELWNSRTVAWRKNMWIFLHMVVLYRCPNWKC